ncbi:hypothetical protein CSKR_203924 [Clonorchis sinensis]|uniref:Uncharacterized protein n=1 Tax=Clonorchis sinensis TaxID=79923 RepID=A0A8T1MET2_CLOSI|nr:hypothetical protein CSKR_203924 [Clonorchis sinensis]
MRRLNPGEDEEKNHTCNTQTFQIETESVLEMNSHTLRTTSESMKRDVTIQRNWNMPSGEEGSPAQTNTDQQMSDPSRSIVADASIPGRPPAPYEPSSVGNDRSNNEMQRRTNSMQEHGSSRLSHPDEESYGVPQHSFNPAPRMIQQSSSGKSGSQNAFKRLRNMGSIAEGSERLPSLPPPGDLGQYGYPITPAKKPEKQYPGYKSYQVTRFLCGSTTFMTIALMLFAIFMTIFAVVKSKDCTLISSTIMLLAVFSLVTVIIEWIRLWLWREPTPLSIRKTKHNLRAEATLGPVHAGGGLPMIANTPGPMANPTYSGVGDNPNGGFLSLGFQNRLYDVNQFISGLCLVLLYIIGAILICVNMAVCGVELGKKENDSNEAKCTELAICGIAFAACMSILLGLRFVMCCLSDACQGLFRRTFVTKSEPPVPIVAINQLHQVLPGMGNYWHTSGEPREGGYQPTTWLVNLSGGIDPRHQLSMIKPMPARYANDLTH